MNEVFRAELLHDNIYKIIIKGFNDLCKCESFIKELHSERILEMRNNHTLQCELFSKNSVNSIFYNRNEIRIPSLNLSKLCANIQNMTRITTINLSNVCATILDINLNEKFIIIKILENDIGLILIDMINNNKVEIYAEPRLIGKKLEDSTYDNIRLITFDIIFDEEEENWIL